MPKFIKILFTLVIVSCFYYPFNSYLVPARYNTKLVLGIIGILICILYLLKNRSSFPRNIIPVFLFAGTISLMSIFSVTWNNTTDTSYVGYIVSMAVWFSASLVVCSLIKSVHGKIDIPILCNYLIAISVIQCFLALMIDNIPAFQTYVDTRVVRGNALMHELNRLYGIGCGLDTAGIHFSLCLIMIAYLLRTRKAELSGWSIFLYIASFIIITSVGSMIARTTYVGVILAIGYLVVTADYSSINISRDTIKVLGVMGITLAVGIIILVYEYRTNASIRHWLRFAFEGFFNLFENGTYSVASNETLKEMYIFPDNLKTWIIGDGYFNNPYWSDPNYIWSGWGTPGGYYMGTDVGYLRFIFYFGLIGLAIFALFLCKCCQICIDLMPEHKWLFLFFLACGFVVWLKVATDVFFIFALFICVGNMQDPPEEDELEEMEEAA